MFDWVLDTPLTCLKKDKNCKKPVKELFLETLQQRLRNSLRNFWEKLYREMIFVTVVFSKFCKKSRSCHQRCSIKKAVLNNFAIFTRKHLCRSLFLIKWRLQHRCFSLNIVKFLKNIYFEKHLQTTASVNPRAAVFQESCFTKCLNFWNL